MHYVVDPLIMGDDFEYESLSVGSAVLDMPSQGRQASFLISASAYRAAAVLSGERFLAEALLDSWKTALPKSSC